jgi:hypothetical protein
MRGSNRATRLKVLTLGLATAALVAPLAFGHGAGKFGSKLTTDTQPSNGAPGLKCEPNENEKCTFIMNEAYAPPNPDGKQKAPKDGTINKVELIAATKGSFKLQIAKVKGNGKAKIVKNGGKISYDGQTGNGNHYKIEKFNVDIPIKKGEYLAARATKISFVRCSSGGDNTLIYQPRLKKGNPYDKPSGSDGCWMLLEAFYK